MPRYKYFVDSVEVEPLNAYTQNLSYEPNEASGVVFDTKLTGDFIFLSTGAFNFKTQEASDLCAELDFQIQQMCGGGAWAIIFEGVFSVSEGKFDNTNCTFTIRPRKKLYLLDDVEVNILEVPDRVFGGGASGVITNPLGGLNRRAYTNARWLKDVLLYVAKKSNFRINEVVSDFFQINPVNISTFAIPGVDNKWLDLAVSALSDVQEPIPSNEATKEIITFKELMNDLQALFSVVWIIDSNYDLRIEHETFFETGIGLDLTVPEFDLYTEGTNKYTYDLNELPKQEIWRIVDHGQHVTVDYTGLSALNKNQNVKTYSTKKIRTDYRTIRHDLNNSTADGLFLFATDGGSVTAGSEIRMWQNTFDENIYLKPEYLVRYLHTYNRPSVYGLFVAKHNDNLFTKSGGVVFESVRPVLKQEPFSVPLCCESFDTTKQITTILGTGYLSKAEYRLRDGTIKLDLKYKIDSCGDIDPTDLGDLRLWLKRDTGITLTGSFNKISQWADQSGNGLHASQAVANQQPQYIAPSPVFFQENASAGATHFENLKTPAFQLFPNKRGTIFLFISDDEVAFGGGPTPMSSLGPISVLSTHDGGAGNFFDIGLNPSHAFIMNVAGTLYPSNGVPTAFNWAPVGLYVIRRTSDATLTCRLNGINCADNPMTIPNTLPSVKPLVLGYNANHTSAPGGTLFISELMVYDRDLTDYEVEQIEMYFLRSGLYNNLFPKF